MQIVYEFLAPCIMVFLSAILSVPQSLLRNLDSIPRLCLCPLLRPVNGRVETESDGTR